MKITFDRKSNGLAIRFVEEKTAGRWLRLVIVLLIAFLLGTYLAFVLPEVVAWVIFGIYSLGFLFVALRNLFGVYELDISTEGLTLKRGLGPFASNCHYMCADVDWLAFSPEVNAYRNHQDSSLAILVRQNVTARAFAHTITPHEATLVFDELRAGPDWIARLIRPVGTLPL